MKAKLAVLLVVLFSIFLLGCTSANTNDYAAYNQPQGQQQGGQYVGGGCGVAPVGNAADTPVDSFGSVQNGL